MDTPSSAPFPALLAEVTRGTRVESRHFGHAVVVDSSGKILFAAGNPQHPTFPRSSLKPIQALACLARGTDTAFDLTDDEIAVTCASHQAEPRQLDAVRRILGKIGATEEDLRCGPHFLTYAPVRDELIRAGKSPTPLFSNCSGKHAGMLALARLLEAPLQGYWEEDHPVQREVRRAIAALCDVPPGPLPSGMDGCGVPNYLLPLRNLALGFARLADPSGLPEEDARAARRITEAMTAEPGQVSEEGRLDTILMSSLPGTVISKGGAEGCEAVAVPGRGIGIAVKIEDGTARALPPVVLSLLERMGILPEPLPTPLLPLRRPVLTNTRGEQVGEIRSRV